MSASSSGIGFFGVWQVINFVLYWGIDAPWNRVQRWPFWGWLSIQSVAFPTVLGLIIAAIALSIAGVTLAWSR